MAATRSQAPDPTSEEKAEQDNRKEQPLSAKNETAVSPNFTQDASTIGHPRDNIDHQGLFGSPGDHVVYSPNVYAPQMRAFYYRGEQDEYPSYVNAKGLGIRSPGLYNDNPLVFHAGYGYGPQMPYGPYSPVTTPLPAVGGDAQLYSPQQFSFSGPPYYQQLGPPSMSYARTPTPVSQPQLNTLANIDQQGDSTLFGPRPSYPSPVDSFSRGSFPGNLGSLGFHDLQHGFDRLRAGGLWSNWSKPSDRHRPLTPLSPVVSSQQVGTFGSSGQNVGIAAQQQQSFYGIESSSNSYRRAYLQSGCNQRSSFGGASVCSLGANSRGRLPLENSRRLGRGSVSLCSCNGSLDILSEQNRGPRVSKLKSQSTAERSSSVDNKHSRSTAKTHDESYNRQDFVTEYKDARFFIIKSYSEDNVHKSIKYGVWASTPNGNRKLDTAYSEAKEKQDPCPVFLFFSVNASAQFCGVAEMVGPVDFDKNVDYWQQDKWSGQFPVKWHVIKDVPNSQFRHIVLENNDNKPVTNSRGTQEVKLEQGIEMLNIFKNHETDMSILDDFDFYEDRQKAMQEWTARQQVGLMVGSVVGGSERRNTVNLPTDLIKQMSKSFVQVVRVDESSQESTGADRDSSGSDGSMGTRAKLEDAIVAVPSVQAS